MGSGKAPPATVAASTFSYFTLSAPSTQTFCAFLKRFSRNFFAFFPKTAKKPEIRRSPRRENGKTTRRRSVSDVRG
jgi:hypothetical protein